MKNTQSSTPPLTGGEAQDKAEVEEQTAKVEKAQAAEPYKLTTREDAAAWLRSGYVTLTSDVAPTETSTGSISVVQVPIIWLLDLFFQQGRAAEEAAQENTGRVGE